MDDGNGAALRAFQSEVPNLTEMVGMLGCRVAATRFENLYGQASRPRHSPPHRAAPQHSTPLGHTSPLKHRTAHLHGRHGLQHLTSPQRQARHHIASTGEPPIAQGTQAGIKHRVLPKPSGRARDGPPAASHSDSQSINPSAHRCARLRNAIRVCPGARRPLHSLDWVASWADPRPDVIDLLSLRNRRPSQGARAQDPGWPRRRRSSALRRRTRRLILGPLAAEDDPHPRSALPRRSSGSHGPLSVPFIHVVGVKNHRHRLPWNHVETAPRVPMRRSSDASSRIVTAKVLLCRPHQDSSAAGFQMPSSIARHQRMACRLSRFGPRAVVASSSTYI
ncbi:hypothetical protein ACCO45_003900 [Purpureocillium lilacinum]|uniref:Uncharacterized protein n=1 Tax=Purpureocillium lilacinum TaxID=33203 RepID=A0ACC4E194_PURLI